VLRVSEVGCTGARIPCCAAVEMGKVAPPAHIALPSSPAQPWFRDPLLEAAKSAAEGCLAMQPQHCNPTKDKECIICSKRALSDTWNCFS